jgi:hypothetical protein
VVIFDVLLQMPEAAQLPLLHRMAAGGAPPRRHPRLRPGCGLARPLRLGAGGDRLQGAARRQPVPAIDDRAGCGSVRGGGLPRLGTSLLGVDAASQRHAGRGADRPMKRPMLLLAAGLAAAPAAAQEVRRPLLELGAFGGAGLVPDYPASDRSEFRALALPWLIYRGEIVQSDERGLRSRLYRATDLELTLNVNGALSSSSSGGAREGMPDLEYLGEVGPSLRWTPWRDEARRTRMTVELPVRAAFGTDLSRIRHRGFVFAPEVALERNGVLTEGGRARIGLRDPSSPRAG